MQKAVRTMYMYSTVLQASQYCPTMHLKGVREGLADPDSCSKLAMEVKEQYIMGLCVYVV